MYDFESSNSGFSDEYSDVEYNTLDPYDYDLNNFTNDKAVEERPEDKLLDFLDSGDLSGVTNILPGLLKLEDEIKVCNGDTNVSESGDVESDISGDEISNGEEEDILEERIAVKMKEVFLKGGDTPLMVAVSSAYPDLVEYIISLGVDVNYCIPNSNKCALLALTCNVCVGWRYINNTWREEAPKCLKMLIDAGVNVKVKGFLATQESGFTALHYAVQSNYWEMLDLLINAGADVDALSNQRETALMIAASKGYVACCNILLLAGANAHLTDRSGSTAAYLAGIEGHKTLSDSISVFSGSAQNNVDLYKIWSQYVQKASGPSNTDHSIPDICDSISNTCIKSFCLALDAPQLVTIMLDQGVTISDLKLMNANQLKEMGVSDEYCDKITAAMQDFNRKTNSKNSKISFEHGRPLKVVSILEMVGNISEHIELIDTNLDCWYSHLNKKYQQDSVLRKATIHKLQAASHISAIYIHSLIDQLQQLKDICDRRTGSSGRPKVDNNLRTMSGKVDSRPGIWSRSSGIRHVTIAAAISLAAMAVTVAIISRRIK